MLLVFFVKIAYFTQEMLKQGFLAGGGFYSMYAHKEEQVKLYLNAVDRVFQKIANLGSSVSNKLDGLPAQAGFGRIN